VIGAYYYLRVIKLMYFDDPVENEPIVARTGMRWLLTVNALALLAIIPWVGSLFDLCQRIIREMT